MADEDFWMLSPREYYALQDVQQTSTKLWAIGLATIVNTQLGGGEPYLAEDFLGTGDRAERERKKQKSDMAAAHANRKLMSIRPARPGQPEPEGLPAWARKDFTMTKPVHSEPTHA